MNASPPFAIRFDAEGVAWLSGELDLATAASFSEALKAGLDSHQPVLDCSDLTFIDSSGIRAVVQLAKMSAQAVVLRNLPPNVRKVLGIAGVDETMGVRFDPRG